MNQEGLVNRMSSTVLRSASVCREQEEPQTPSPVVGGGVPATRSQRAAAVSRNMYMMLGPTRRCILATALVIGGLCAAGLVVFFTQRAIYARIEEHQRVRQYLRDVLGETGPERYPGAPFPQQEFIFACQTEHCSKEGKHLRRNVAWSLDPCRDFHEYACSGEARRPSLREDALNHFLIEVRSVLGKWGEFRWSRTPPMHSKAYRFFRSCHGTKHDRESIEHDLAQYLRDVDRAHRLPEAWAAEVSRTLQLFPVFEIGVAEVSSTSCIVLKDPDQLDGDAVLGMPTIVSRKHRQLVRKMMKADAKFVDSALQFAWSLRAFGGPPDDALAPLSSISHTTVSALAAKLNGEWRWERFLEAFFLGHLDVDGHTCVIVRAPSYMSHVAEVTKEAKAEAVRAYFSYSLHLHLWPFWALLDGDKEQHEQACALLTYRLFNFAFLKHFNDTARMGVVAKAGLKEAVVRNSYRIAMLQSGDIPSGVRERVLDSIADSDKSYFNHMDDVDAYYEPTQTVVVDWRHILPAYLQIRHSLVPHWLKRVVGSGGRVFDSNLDLACHFDPDTKTLGIPMSITDVDVGGREFFLDIPTVGLLMARSIYRIFQEHAMWSSELQPLRVCLQRAYGNLSAADGRSRRSVDGFRCLRTSVMDHVVLKAVHKSYKTAVVTFSPQSERGHRLRDVSLHFPEVPNVSSEQLFFLLYAQSFCELHEDVADVVQRASWAPAKVRLNRQLADFGPFADAFRCARGTPMHPAQRCPT
ncbi:neprilysin-1-like [Dermacentor variabilis]|uniref:neprilysin-1-like n=1 Tax=Dermacentor variabilis TaxID=34621 RepID=UPI003F5B957D